MLVAVPPAPPLKDLDQGYALEQRVDLDTAYSEEGRALNRVLSSMVDYIREPVSLASKRSQAHDDLLELQEEHVEQGWDGDVAPAVTSASVKNAKLFIAMLPSDIPDPDLAVDPDDGAISLEWYGGYRKVASVSINDNSRIPYAVLNGMNSCNGVLELDGNAIPGSFVALTKEVLG